MEGIERKINCIWEVLEVESKWRCSVTTQTIYCHIQQYCEYCSWQKTTEELTL